MFVNFRQKYKVFVIVSKTIRNFVKICNEKYERFSAIYNKCERQAL